MKYTNMKLVMLLMSLFFTNILIAQSAIKISGVVKDKESAETLIGVNLYWASTGAGTTTDWDGQFVISLDKEHNNDSLIVSYIGYNTELFAASELQDSMLIRLSSQSHQLAEVVVKPDYSYDELLMQRIISAKDKNRPQIQATEYYEEEEDLSIYLDNISEARKNSKRFRKNKAAFIPLSDSTYSLPLMYQQERYGYSTAEQRRLISSEKTLVAQQFESLIQEFLNVQVKQQIDFYDNKLLLLDRAFLSPIAKQYKNSYNVYLVDSLEQGHKVYQFDFYPRNEHTTALKGSFWVDAQDYGLLRMIAEVPVAANVNFIKNYTIDYQYQKAAGEQYELSHYYTSLQLAIAKNKKENSFRLEIKGRQLSQDEQVATWIDEQMLEQSPNVSEKTYNIIKNRKKLNKDSIQKKIKNLRSNSLLKTVNFIGSTALTGYMPTGKIQIGPVFDFYSRNIIEGNRFTIPLRTSALLSENYAIGAYLGYGTKNEAFKYGLRFDVLLPYGRRTELRVQYSDDYHSLSRNPFIEFIQENPYSKGGGGNVLAVLNGGQGNKYLLRQKKLELNLGIELSTKWHLNLRPFYKKYYANAHNPFEQADRSFDAIKNPGLLVDVRYSKSSAFDQQHFQRFYYGARKPVWHFTTEFGAAALQKQEKQYYAHTNISVKQVFFIGSFKVKAFADVGAIVGKVPYPFLYNPQSAQGIAMGRYAYNLLDNYSMVSNIYSNVHLYINGGGFFLNEIPLIKKLKLRESFSLKMFNGRLHNYNTNELLHPDTRLPQSQPYIEAGVGLTNVFKVLRIEYVFRLNQQNYYDSFSKKGALKFRIAVAF